MFQGFTNSFRWRAGTVSDCRLMPRIAFTAKRATSKIRVRISIGSCPKAAAVRLTTGCKMAGNLEHPVVQRLPALRLIYGISVFFSIFKSCFVSIIIFLIKARFPILMYQHSPLKQTTRFSKKKLNVIFSDRFKFFFVFFYFLVYSNSQANQCKTVDKGLVELSPAGETPTSILRLSVPYNEYLNTCMYVDI